MSRLRHPYFLSTAGLFLALLITLLVVDRPVKAEREIARREAEGKKPTLKTHVPVWLWKGLCVNVGLAAGLVALTPLAVRRLSGEKTRPAREQLTKLEWMVVLAAGGLFLWTSVPRLDHSMWGDEENLVDTTIADETTLQPDGSVTITPLSWRETFWAYPRPTNHIGYSVVARLFHEVIYRPSTGPTDPFFSEMAVRLPVLLSALGWFVGLIWCCRVWGWTRGVAPVALAMAGHGWMVRFGVDARGYGFVVLLVFLMLGFLGKALQSGQWRWWLGFGAAQAYLLWIHPGAIHVPVMMNLAALVMIWQDREDRWVLLTRCVVVNWLGAMFIIGMMAPILTPFKAFLARKALDGDLDLFWFQNMAAYLAVGAPWHPWSSENPYSTSLRLTGLLPAWANLMALLFLAAVAGWGIWKLVCHRQQRWLLVFMIGGPALMILHVLASHTRPYYWYLIPFLPALCLLWAAGLQHVGRARPGVMVALVLSVHALAWKQCRLLVEHPLEPIRESVALTREITNPRHPDYNKGVITACCLMTAGSYDRGALRFRSVQELRAIMAKADQQKVPLFVNFGFRGLYEATQKEILQVLDNPDLFEQVAVLPGLFESTTREVRRYRGMSPAP